MADATTLDEVERLNRLEEELPPHDGVRWFNRLYLRVTEHVAEYVNAVPQKVFWNGHFRVDDHGFGPGGGARRLSMMATIAHLTIASWVAGRRS
jgi:hypothetical protein